MSAPGAFARWAAQLIDCGYSPVPIVPGEKRPLPQLPSGEGWDVLRCRTLTLGEIAALVRRHPSLGLSVAGGFSGLVPIDVDFDDEDKRRAIKGTLPPTLIAKKGQTGATAFYRDRAGLVQACKFLPPPPNRKPLIEILKSGQTVLPPTVHPETGMAYRWLTPATLFNTPVDRLPEITPDHIEALAKAIEPYSPRRPEYVPRALDRDAPAISDKRLVSYARTILGRESRALAAMGKDSGRNNSLFRLVCVLGTYVHHGLLPETELRARLMAACESNGLVKHTGARACHKTIESGLKKSRSDPLPVLEDRKRAA